MKPEVTDEVKAELVDAARVAKQLPGENEFWNEVEAIWNADAKDTGLVEKRNTGAV